MHICHFSELSVEPAYFKNIASGLTEKGIQVSMLSLGFDGPPEWLSDYPGVRYFNLRVGGWFGLPFAIFRLARLCRRERVDLLQAHLYRAGLLSVLTRPLLARTSVVINRHHTSAVRMLGTPFHVALDKWMAEKADHVITVSEAARVFMREVDKIRAEVEVVHLGFDFRKLEPDQIEGSRLRKEFGLAEDDFVIGYIGNLVPGKGHVQLINSYAKLVESIPRVRLLLVGNGRLPEIDSTIGRLGLGRRVVFAGWRTDISACLNAMDVFVQPSLSEAFSQVLIEAMAVGLPVVATTVGGAEEVITHGQSGFLVPPENVDAIVLEVLNIFSDRTSAAEVAKAGQESVRERFTVKQMVDKQLDLYKKWLATD